MPVLAAPVAPTPDPPATPDALTQLVAHLELGRGEFSLLFACYDRPSQRRRIIAGLRERLSTWNFAEVSLQDTRFDYRNQTGAFFERLREIALTSAGEQPPDALLLLDWDQRLPQDTPEAQWRRDTLLALFNLGRNLLQEQVDWPLVVLIPQSTLRILERRAPDFTSWASTHARFDFRPEAVVAELHAWLAKPPPSDVRAATEEASALEEAWGDLDQEPYRTEPAVQEVLPGVLARLGELWSGPLHSPLDADSWFERLEKLAKEQNSKQWLRRARQGRKGAGRPRRRPTIAPLQESRGLASLTEQDPLFGRDEELARLLDLLSNFAFRCGTLWGESGCGKTSLVRAGAIRSLRIQGNLPVYVEEYGGLEAGLARAVREAAGLPPADGTLAEAVAAAVRERGLARTSNRVVLLCDQFERLFHPEVSCSERRKLLEALAGCVNDTKLPFCLLFLMRADRLYHLGELDPLIRVHHPLNAENRMQLGWIRSPEAVRVLNALNAHPAESWSEAFSQVLVHDLERDGRVRPADLQMLWQVLRVFGIRDEAAYREAGGRAALLESFLAAALQPLPDAPRAREILPRFVLRGAPPILEDRTLQELVERTGLGEREVQQDLDALVKAKLVRARFGSEPTRYCLMHDSLAEACLRAADPTTMARDVLWLAMVQNRFLKPIEYYLVTFGYVALETLPPPLIDRARRLLRRSLPGTVVFGFVPMFILICSIL